jgi:hypothetical protein
MLQARRTFQSGGLWTLKEWLVTCRGRSATDPRDLVFGGLSLIKPELLRMNAGIRLAEPAPLRAVSKVSLVRRKYYPRTIPPPHMKDALQIHRIRGHKSYIERGPLIPNRLWPGLRPDYTVDTAEVLVNTAACLLSHTGAAEILSIAARPSLPTVYSSKWWIAASDKPIVDDLPSWAPTPGSWAVS